MLHCDRRETANIGHSGMVPLTGGRFLRFTVEAIVCVSSMPILTGSESKTFRV